MNLVVVDISDVPRIRYGKKKLFNILDRFNESGATAVRVDFAEHEYSSADSCCAAFNAAAKRYGFNRIRGIVRKEKVYLIKEEP